MFTMRTMKLQKNTYELDRGHTFYNAACCTRSVDNQATCTTSIPFLYAYSVTEFLSFYTIHFVCIFAYFDLF